MSRRLTLSLALLLAAIVAPATAMALPAQPDPGQWTLNANATVRAVLPTADATYVGGSFTYAGPRTGSGLVTDAASGDARGGRAVYDGTVDDAVPDGVGGAYVAGSFTNLGGSGRSYLARLRPDGSVDPAFAPAPDGPVRALATLGGVVYAAGSFDNLGGAVRNGLGAVNAAGAATAWNPNPDYTVNDVAVGAGSIYAGGYFSAIGGGSSPKVARLHPTTGALVAGFTPPALNDDVNGITVAPNGSDLYIWGYFDTPTSSIAQLSATTGAATAWDPQPGAGRVTSVAVSADSQTVYLGGYFTLLKAQSRAGIGAVSRAAGATLQAWYPALEGALYPGTEMPQVSDLVRDGNDIYVGGSFLRVGGVERHGAARVSTAGAVTGWNPDVSDPANAFVALGSGDVFTGGQFVAARGVVRRNLAAFDTRGVATAWNPDVRHNAPYSAQVMTLALSPGGDTVYAGGDFVSVGGQARRALAGISAATGAPTALDAQLLFGALPNSTDVRTIAAHPDGRLFVGGHFTTVQGSARNGVAAVSGATGAPTAWNAGSNTEWMYALALSPDGSRLYAGGPFTTIGGVVGRSYLAALDTTTATDLGWTPKPNTAIDRFALSPDGATIYVAAQFLNTIGNQTPQLTRHQLAAVSTAGAGDAVAAFDAELGAGSQVVHAIGPSADGQRLFVGGSFDAVGGQIRDGFAELSAATGKATPMTLPLGGFAQPRVLAHRPAPGGEQLIVGGSFNAFGPAPVSALLQLRDADPVAPATPVTPVAPDTTAPRIAKASLARRKFAVARRASQRNRGTTVRFTLSEAARVELTVLRKVKGRRADGRCKQRARKGRRCTITRTVGSLPKRAGRKGRNSVRFLGRVRGRALAPGAYVLRLRATDKAGNRSRAVRLKFRVVAPPSRR
jgi:hypothetical protein